MGFNISSQCVKIKSRRLIIKKATSVKQLVEHMEPDKLHGGVPRIKEVSFDDVYSPGDIGRDLDEVERAMASFGEKRAEDNANMLEWGIAHGLAGASTAYGGYSDWFQDFAMEPYMDIEDENPFTVWAASDYDDIKARTDIIMALNNVKVQGLIISIDATSSRNSDVISDKFAGSRKNPALPYGFEELKYVDAKEEAGIKGTVSDVPHFVIGIDADEMFELFNMISSNDQSKVRKRAECRVAFKIADEMYAQARSMEARLKQSEDSGRLAKLSPLVEYLSIARQKTKQAFESVGGNVIDPENSDPVYRTIMVQAGMMMPRPPRIFNGKLPDVDKPE